MTISWTVTFDDSNIEYLFTHLAILTDIEKEMSMQYSDLKKKIGLFFLEMKKNAMQANFP